MKKIYYLYLILFLFLIIIINEFYHSVKRQMDRLRLFDLADKKSKELNKPLIVIGDPYNGLASRFYSKVYKSYAKKFINLSVNRKFYRR